MPAVFKHSDSVIVVDEDWTARVKDSARQEPLRRARLNLHHSEDDQVQEMLIAFCKDSINYPHRHLAKSESMHMVEGRVLVVFFADDGCITRRLRLGAPGTGLPCLYRLAAPEWHTVIPLDDIVVIHETTTGPFLREHDSPPSWVPRDEASLRAFVDGLIDEHVEAADTLDRDGPRKTANGLAEV
jgi:cupin fold WbuC family metalloprotein